MELVHSKFELDMCELSLDLLDPMLREPTKTEYMHEMLELGDTYPINILSTRTGNSILTQDMLLNPNFGQRIQAVQWYEKAIDIAAYTNSQYVGGYFGGLVIQEHTDPKMKEYLISFLIESMDYLASIAYTAGVYGIIIEPISLVPDEKENYELNSRILNSLSERVKVEMKVSPIAVKHDLSVWVKNSPDKIQMIQIKNAKEAKVVKSILEKSKLESNHTMNIILNTAPSFELSPKDCIDVVHTQVKEIKKEFTLN
jgi:hypothetical protein